MAAADLQVVILDVGMGLSILLVEDGHGLLVDTGLAEYSEHVLSRMEYHGVQTLDYLVLSHLHPDHAGGYAAIRKAWPETVVFDTCHSPEKVLSCDQKGFEKIYKTLLHDPLHQCLSAGDTITWKKHKLKVLWPARQENSDLNHNSLVLLFSEKEGGHLLLMGDVDKTVENGLGPILKTSLRGDPLDLYVAAHHAAADSCDPDFIRLLSPNISIVSVGLNNIYGYPDDASMQLLESYSSTVLRTDRDGEILLNFNGETVTDHCIRL